MMPAQLPAARLRLKRSSGWFAAGLEVSTALPMLSEAAFKLYIFLCSVFERGPAQRAEGLGADGAGQPARSRLPECD